MSELFSSFDLAGLALKNRVVMAPMTRSRAPNDVADERIALYYAQRATAGLIVTEGTPISREGQGYLFIPGVFTPEQVRGWKLATQSVHAVGGSIFAQLWHVGRVSHPSIQEDGRAPVSATSKVAANATAYGYNEDGEPGFVDAAPPRPLATDEVGRVASDFAKAAANAIEAGFDGVEIHGANGYLLEQFLNPGVNDRTDRYAADTMENRLRFALEVVDAVCDRVGAHRVGLRISPYGKLFDMPHYEGMDETYTALVAELGRRDLAYVHVMDQSNYFMGDAVDVSFERVRRLLRGFRTNLPRTAIILAGGLNRKRAEALIGEGTIDLAAFGQPFIANPDLVARMRNDWPLTQPDRATYYGGGAAGYVDYAPHRAGADAVRTA